MPSERRHGSRCAVQPSAYVWWGSDHKAIIRNVGNEGIGILGSSVPKCDFDVDLPLKLVSKAGILNTRGRVAWTNDTGEAGIHLQLQEWRVYFQRWRCLNEKPASAVEPIAMQATSAALASTVLAPSQTVGDVDYEHGLRELRACWLRNLEADLEAERVRAVRIRHLAAITLAGLICGGTIWALRGRSSHFGSPSPPPSTASESPQPTASPTEATAAPVLSLQPPAPAVSLPVVDAQSRAALLEVLPGISYESGPNFARFFIDVREYLNLHAVALKNPDRIYVDVPKSAARVRHKSVDMNNDFVRRIRVSSRGGGVTRVVLDLKCSCTYRFQPPSGPQHWVQIEVRPRAAETAHLHTRPLS